MAKRMQTFLDLVDAISEDIGVQSTDTVARNKIKRFVNMIYVDEVASFKQWEWLKKSTSIIHHEYYNTGTMSVTPDSTTITFSVAPNITEGSFKGYRFSVDGNNEVYTIASHTAASTTAVLTSAYKESLDATADYKIWRDRVDLPTEAKETIEIWHAQQSTPLSAVGLQGFRKFEAALPKQEGYPSTYHTGDFYDPSPSDDETESDRYRQTLIWPAITTTPLTLNVDYIQDVTELDDDTDEPLMPVNDRNVIYLGASAMAWSIIGRNEEMHDKRYALYQAKLARMAGEREDGMDTPSLSPKSSYLNNIRRSGLKSRSLAIASQGGGSSVAMPSYLADVTINGATVTGNITVNTDVTIDGRDISDDGTLLDSLVTPQSVTLTDNTTNQAAVTWVVATYDTIHIDYSVHRGSAREAGRITLSANDGTTPGIAIGNVSGGGTGVSFSADISGGTLRLLSTTTSTGSAATLKYREFKWLS
jgi:hypothetical protein